MDGLGNGTLLCGLCIACAVFARVESYPIGTNAGLLPDWLRAKERWMICMHSNTIPIAMMMRIVQDNPFHSQFEQI